MDYVYLAGRIYVNLRLSFWPERRAYRGAIR